MFKVSVGLRTAALVILIGAGGCANQSLSTEAEGNARTEPFVDASPESVPVVLTYRTVDPGGTDLSEVTFTYVSDNRWTRQIRQPRAAVRGVDQELLDYFCEARFDDVSWTANGSDCTRHIATANVGPPNMGNSIFPLVDEISGTTDWAQPESPETRSISASSVAVDTPSSRPASPDSQAFEVENGFGTARWRVDSGEHFPAVYEFRSPTGEVYISLLEGVAAADEAAISSSGLDRLPPTVVDQLEAFAELQPATAQPSEATQPSD